VNGERPVRVPGDVLEGLEVVRRYARTETPDVATVRYAAMELGQPALVVWIDGHRSEYGRGLLDGFEAED
jgi:hypothetical protein